MDSELGRDATTVSFFHACHTGDKLTHDFPFFLGKSKLMYSEVDICLYNMLLTSRKVKSHAHVRAHVQRNGQEPRTKAVLAKHKAHIVAQLASVVLLRSRAKIR